MKTKKRENKKLTNPLTSTIMTIGVSSYPFGKEVEENDVYIKTTPAVINYAIDKTSFSLYQIKNNVNGLVYIYFPHISTVSSKHICRDICEAAEKMITKSDIKLYSKVESSVVNILEKIKNIYDSNKYHENVDDSFLTKSDLLDAFTRECKDYTKNDFCIIEKKLKTFYTTVSTYASIIEKKIENKYRSAYKHGYTLSKYEIDRIILSVILSIYELKSKSVGPFYRVQTSYIERKLTIAEALYLPNIITKNNTIDVSIDYIQQYFAHISINSSRNFNFSVTKEDQNDEEPKKHILPYFYVGTCTLDDSILKSLNDIENIVCDDKREFEFIVAYFGNGNDYYVFSPVGCTLIPFENMLLGELVVKRPSSYDVLKQMSKLIHSEAKNILKMNGYVYVNEQKTTTDTCTPIDQYFVNMRKQSFDNFVKRKWNNHVISYTNQNQSDSKETDGQ